MNKYSFLKALEKNLKFMSDAEKKDIVKDYHTHFEEGALEKKSEEEIAVGLGKPEEIAKELNAVYALNKVEEKRSVKNILRALVSIMGLSVLNFMLIVAGLLFLVILSPFILAYIIGVPVMIVSPLILIVMGFINGFQTIGLGEVMEAGKGLVIGSFLAIVGFYVGKYFIKLVVKNLKWNLSIVRGRT